MSDLRDQINNLSAAEKAELLDTLWESLETDSASLTDAQRAELDCRITLSPERSRRIPTTSSEAHPQGVSSGAIWKPSRRRL